MSEPLLNVMKIMLLLGLYLFFVRVLWSVFSQLRDPRTVARKRAAAGPASAPVAGNGAARRAAPAGEPAFPSPAMAQSAGGVATATPTALGQLMVVDPPNLVGVTFAVGNEITVGRAPTNGIPLDDTYISTVHARIFCTNGTFFIEDLASRNGSTINGQDIVATTALLPGDRVQLGSTTMEFS